MLPVLRVLVFSMLSTGDYRAFAYDHSFVQLIDDAVGLLFPPVKVSAYSCHLDEGEGTLTDYATDDLPILIRFVVFQMKPSIPLRYRDLPVEDDVESRANSQDSSGSRGIRERAARHLGSSSVVRAGFGLRPGDFVATNGIVQLN